MPRTLLNLGAIAPVPQHSPRRPRKRTPCRRQPDGTATERTGDREWFSDRLFVESQVGHAKSGYGVSLLVHACAAGALLAFLMTRPILSIVVRMESLSMPAFARQRPPDPVLDVPPAEKAGGRPSKVEAVAPAAAAPPRLGVSAPAPVPIEAPPDIKNETGAEGQVDGVESGVSGGVAGGAGTIAGGAIAGVGFGPATGTGPVVMRAGVDMKPPRKIRDVKPVYPAGALPLRAQGAVLIEAVIGPDGRVQDARVLHSVGPFLDQAALDAVRQWVYEPSQLNGEAVAVIMTVVVNFALQ